MKSYVITIWDNPHSMHYADRCIKSGATFDIEIHKFHAFTPKSNPSALAKGQNIDTSAFNERYSRFENCLAAFLSHYTLWKTCIEIDEEVQIFEHDAVITNDIPKHLDYNGCISLGAPSYGKFNTPTKIGVNSLVSKPYFPGAHAYRITPQRAKTLCDRAKTEAAPTDLYLDIRRFDFLEEYYPWPVEARDNFTTIQNESGCLAKHQYGPGYQIL